MEVNEITKLHQKECSLCQKYGNQKIIDGKYCIGFVNDECKKCSIFIMNHRRNIYNMNYNMNYK